MATFTTEEKVGLLFKKFLGKPSTDSSIEFFSEPSFPARPRIIRSQIWSDDVPDTRPASDWNTSQDFTTVLGAAVAGTSYSHDTYSMDYVHQHAMVKVTSGNDMCFKIDDGGNNLLASSIPFNYDPAGGYGVKLYRKDGGVGAQIYDGTGNWVVDADAGTVTFYEWADVSGFVDEDTPPYISFFRYTGSTGLGSGGLWSSVSHGIKYNTASKTVLIGLDSSSSEGTYDLEVNGTALFGTVIAPTVTSGSDRRLKRDIVPIKDPLQRLAAIEGVDFVWRGTGKKSTGVIAQAVQAVQPWSVQTMDKHEKFLGVHYNDLVGLCVAGINAQQSQLVLKDKIIGEQGARIDRLEQCVQVLEGKNEKDEKGHRSLGANVEKRVLWPEPRS